MTELPLVSVICVCFNHEKFVAEAIGSVLNQDYANIEIIVIDDASTDESVSIIEDVRARHPSIAFLRNPENIGLCKSFNKALSIAKGAFIIDFATDDVMMPDRIRRQVEHFDTLDESWGVIFTDAVYVDINGEMIHGHYEYLRRKKLLFEIPQGDVYRHVLSTYFICPPTVMSRRAVFDAIGGYDEELAYEDFDFWIRSSRIFRYAYLDVISTKVRRSSRSLSSRLYQKGDKQLYSTWLVCRKAVALNRTEEERRALGRRLRYEQRHAVLSGNFPEAELFQALLKETGERTPGSEVIFLIGKLRLPLFFLRRWYQRLRYG